jgi:hypothetical protein
MQDAAGGGALRGDEENRYTDANIVERLNSLQYSNGKIEIKLPSGWILSDKSSDETYLYFAPGRIAAGGGALTGDEEDNRLIDFTIIIVDSVKTKEDIVQEVMTTDTELVDYGETTSNGKEALFFIEQSDWQKKKILYILDKDNGSLYILEYKAETNEYNESTANYMIDSFKIK